MNNREIAKKIKEDISNNVYFNFPMLRSRLRYISNKLQVINSNITKGERTTLRENDYV